MILQRICQGIKSNADMSLTDNNEVKMSLPQIMGHVLAQFMLSSIYYVAALIN